MKLYAQLVAALAVDAMVKRTEAMKTAGQLRLVADAKRARIGHKQK